MNKEDLYHQALVAISNDNTSPIEAKGVARFALSLGKYFTDRRGTVVIAINEVGPKRLNVIKVIRQYSKSPMALVEAKEITDTVLNGMSAGFVVAAEDRKRVISELAAVGCTAY